MLKVSSQTFSRWDFSKCPRVAADQASIFTSLPDGFPANFEVNCHPQNRWTMDLEEKLAAAAKAAQEGAGTESKGRLELQTLQNAGHWLHVRPFCELGCPKLTQIPDAHLRARTHLILHYCGSTLCGAALLCIVLAACGSASAPEAMTSLAHRSTIPTACWIWCCRAASRRPRRDAGGRAKLGQQQPRQ